MTQIKSYIIPLLAAITLLYSCRGTDVNGDDLNGEGIVSVAIRTDSVSFGVESASALNTKAEPLLTPADFKISLENTKAETLKAWDSYNDMPTQLHMVFGSYKLQASYGDINLLPAFEKPVYGAQAKFAVSAQSPKAAVELNCKPLAAKVSLTFSDKFANNYSKYSVAVKSVGDSLHFYTADQGREAYFKPGLLRLRFVLERKEEPGKEYYYVYNTKITAKAAHYYRMTLNAINTSGQLGITIETDGTTNDILLEQGIPDFWLPRDAPDVLSHAFGEQMIVETTEGLSKVANVLFRTRAGVKNAVIKTTSEFLKAKGFPTEGIDIMRAKEAGYAEKINLLKSLGVTWSDNLNDKNGALLLTSIDPVLFDFKPLVANLDTEPLQNTDHTFEIVVSDKYGQTNEPFKFTVRVAPPQINLHEIIDADVWAQKAFLSVDYDLDRGNYKPRVQVSTDAGATWSYPTQAVTEAEQGEMDFEVQNLVAATEYKFRVALGKHVVENDKVFTTEPASQLPNGDMEKWSMDYFDGTWPGYDIARYYPWTQGDSSPFWDTGNDRTTCYRVQAGGINMYTLASGTMYTYIAKAGNKAAEIRTVGANGGDTPINSSGVNAESNRVRGRLLVGDYSYSKGSFKDNINYGKPFASRPTALSLWYQYLPIDASGDTFGITVEVWNQVGAIKTSLGKATFTKKQTASSVQYEELVIPIEYTNKAMKATHFTVEFVSTTDQTPRTSTNIKTTFPDIYSPDDWYGHVGSILRVDEIKLIY